MKSVLTFNALPRVLFSRYLDTEETWRFFSLGMIILGRLSPLSEPLSTRSCRPEEVPWELSSDIMLPQHWQYWQYCRHYLLLIPNKLHYAINHIITSISETVYIYVFIEDSYQIYPWALTNSSQEWLYYSLNFQANFPLKRLKINKYVLSWLNNLIDIWTNVPQNSGLKMFSLMCIVSLSTGL